MINTRIKVHDKFTVEFKIGFVTSDKENDKNEYKINTWIFLPNGLDINKYTYSKEQFYTDIKSNVRLITPVFSLSDILTGDESPFTRLKKAYAALLDNQDNVAMESFTYHSKMFLNIMKSALRESLVLIIEEKDEEKQLEEIRHYVANVCQITLEYRKLRNKPEIDKEHFLFGDEYLGQIVEQNTFELHRFLCENANYETIKHLLKPIIEGEEMNKQQMDYSIPDENDDKKNSLILIKRSLLKKLVESDLYLQRIKKEDGALAREFYYSLGAGLAMIFATVISFFAAQKYGNFTSTLFFILVISYIFKDRIKEFSRTYFASKLDQKYFDRKWKVSIRNQPIGWIKEAFDFIDEENVPEKIIELRDKLPLVKAENKVYDEKVILFRTRVQLSKKDIETYKEYRLTGINDIIRLNLTSFIKKMDNPTNYLYLPDEQEGYRSFTATRVYALYFVIECRSDNDTYFKKYRLLLNRNGINDVSQID